MSLKVWLPLDGDLRNLGTSPDITKTSSNTIVWRDEGKIGKKSLDLAAATTFTIPALANVREYSMMCWCKIEDNTANTTNNWIKIFQMQDQTASGTNGTIRFESCYGSSARFASWHNNGTNASYNGSVIFANADEWGKWHHLCLVMGDTYADTYLDGVRLKHLEGHRGDGHLTGNNIQFGATNQKGCMNDVRIYDHALSAAEVHEIAQGLVLHYKLDNNGHHNLFQTDPTLTITIPENATSAYSSYVYINPNIKNNGIFHEGTPYTVTYDYIVNSNGTGSVYVYTQLNTSRSNPSISQTMIRTASATGHVVETFYVTQAQADYSSTFRVRWGINTGQAGNSITIKNVRMYLGTQTDINYISDSSGYNYNGTILGNPIISSDTAKYTSSTSFPANADGILSTYPLTLWNNAFTYSFWIKPSGENGGRSIYAASYSGTSCSIEKTTGNKLRFYWSGSPDLSTSSLTIADGTWQHIAIVKEENKTTVKCYYNGALKDTFTNTFSDKTFSGNLRIARDTRGDATSYTGMMSDFRIYCTALSADDILTLYHTGAKVDNKQNLHTFELVENNSKIQITKTGQACCNELKETTVTKLFKTNQIIETNEIIES